MNKQLKKYLGIILMAFLLFQCSTETKNGTNTEKCNPNDPFKNTMPQSQYFDIDAKKDNVVQGQNGTTIVFPKGCFINSKGETVEENINVELAEALSLDEMILSNLTTTSDGKLLETDGMIYFNATADGEQLKINKNNPIYIEIPTSKRKPGMMAYKGIRDENGNMNWIEPKELEKFLIPVDISLLDFYPDGFEAEVEKGMPYKSYNTATKELIDSLYFSLSVSNGSEFTKGFVHTDYNEPYYNENKQVSNGKYSDQSFEVNPKPTPYYQDEVAVVEVDSCGATETYCGIDPAIIKVIKSEKYQNTLISTREFETRLRVIFKTCRDDILEIYIKNIDKNMWELDSMAANTLGEHNCTNDFFRFYEQKLTNTKESKKYSELIKDYYEQKLKEIKSELQSIKHKLVKELQEKNEIAQQIANEYKEVLLKREKHRMETYGFEWTETGWINIDVGTTPKDWGAKKLEILVQNGKSYDRVHTYAVYTSINSIYRLNTSDNETFYVGNNQEREMLMPKRKKGVGISIGYKGETPFLAIKEFETGTETNFVLQLEQTSIKEIKKAIKPYNNYGQENRIDKDLEYMAFFAQEEKRQEKLKSESEFIGRLWTKAYPCCGFESDTVAYYDKIQEMIE